MLASGTVERAAIVSTAKCASAAGKERAVALEPALNTL